MTEVLPLQASPRFRFQVADMRARAIFLWLAALVLTCVQTSARAQTPTAAKPVKYATIEQATAAYESSDYEKAYPMLAQLARNGSVQAKYFLSKLYGEGKGVKQDAAKSLTYLRQAATINYARLPYKFGYPDAQYELAQRFAAGTGVTKSAREAITNLTRAANQSHRKALAELPAYFTGDKGIKKDSSRGYLWAGIAAKTLNGAEKDAAVVQQETFAKDLSERQRRLLDARIRAWEPRRG
jgi:TPR repeat protein